MNRDDEAENFISELARKVEESGHGEWWLLWAVEGSKITVMISQINDRGSMRKIEIVLNGERGWDVSRLTPASPSWKWKSQ